LFYDQDAEPQLKRRSAGAEGEETGGRGGGVGGAEEDTQFVCTH